MTDIRLFKELENYWILHFNVLNCKSISKCLCSVDTTKFYDSLWKNIIG